MTPPKDLNAEATMMVTTANATSLLGDALAPHGLAVDAREMTRRFGIPVREIANAFAEAA